LVPSLEKGQEMLAKVTTCAVVGLDGMLVEVEVDISRGLPSFTIVGLPDTAVQEARERVRAAIRNSGFEFPQQRITVNLAPADLRKEGPSYDLPIALGVLLASGQLATDLTGAMIVGELSLEGQVRHIQGILPMVALAKEKGLRTVYVPMADAEEAALIEGIEVVPVPSLGALIRHLGGEEPIPPYRRSPQGTWEPPEGDEIDLAHIRGHEYAKRALEVAAAGGHNILMVGPPGAGKTLLARALPSILPVMTPEEALEVTKIYSVAGLLPPGQPLIKKRPFRMPHHTISHAGLVGGGRIPKPGEVTLAHRGVLFLDELPEFAPSVLEAIRQPLEDRQVTVSRAQGSVTFPASFMLVAAMNPCPCGYHGDSRHPCKCPESLIARYHRRLSGPFLDRIDLFVEVPRVEEEKLLAETWVAEPSAQVRERVEKARQVQRERFQGMPITCNAEMGPVEVRNFCQRALEEGAHQLLALAMEKLALSARAFHRVLKVARTIADLSGMDGIASAHLAEALQYRQKVLF